MALELQHEAVPAECDHTRLAIPTTSLRVARPSVREAVATAG